MKKKGSDIKLNSHEINQNVNISKCNLVAVFLKSHKASYGDERPESSHQRLKLSMDERRLDAGGERGEQPGVSQAVPVT